MNRGRLWGQRGGLSERRRMFKVKDRMGWGEKKGLLISLAGQQSCISGYGCRLLHWETRTVPWKVTGLQLLKMSSSDWENKCCLYYISDTYILGFLKKKADTPTHTVHLGATAGSLSACLSRFLTCVILWVKDLHLTVLLTWEEASQCCVF